MFKTIYTYVTANIFDSHSDNGNKTIIIKANQKKPKAAAQDAFSIISAITPAFTALPMFFPMGSLIAFIKGIKIIAIKGSKNNSVTGNILFVIDKKTIAPITIVYSRDAK